jgi:outer membrane lipoprotein-sorting protein
MRRQKPNRYGFAWLLGAALLLAPLGVQAQDTGARDLLQKIVDSAPKVPFSAKGKLSSETRGWVREIELSYKHVDGADSSYMEVTAPLDVKDTRFLVYDRLTGDDEQWIYVPSIKRSIKVSAQTRRQPFLGSDFYVSDMSRPNLDNFSHTFVGEAEVNGRKCKLIESVPKNPADEPYSKSVTAADPSDLVIVRTEFFDDKGKPVKLWTIEKLEKIEGIWTPILQRMKNVQENTESILEISEVKYNADVSDEVFRKAYLVR